MRRVLLGFCYFSGVFILLSGCGGEDGDNPESGSVYIGESNTEIGIRIPEQVYSPHLSDGQKHPPYNSKPATSGWHYPNWVKWGVHAIEIPDEYLVHNLEHGGIGIHYNCPEGCSDLVDKLAGIAESFDKIVMSPYSDMDTKISLTSWTFQDGFEEFDHDRITNFIRAHISRPPAPEYSIPP